MKNTVLALLLMSPLLFACSNEELAQKYTEIKGLKVELAQAKDDAREQKKRADFAKEQTKIAQIRAEEVLKDCEGKRKK